MIFVTVGTQLGFDRLVEAVDGWAADHRDQEVFVQYGSGRYRPRWCRGEAYTAPKDWDTHFLRAERIVSHAGMGTILKSLELGKPLVVMPRHAAFGEHRNDHQIATASRFGGIGCVQVVHDAAELRSALDAPLLKFTSSQEPIHSRESLIDSIRQFALRQP